MVTKYWKELPNNLKNRYSSIQATRLRSKCTLSESLFMGKLLDAGFIHYRFQQIFFNDEILTFCDFFLRKPIKLVIEIDGPYHFTKNQQKRDREKDEFYINNKRVHSVLRMTDQQAIDITINDLRKLILSINKGGIYVLYELPKFK